MLCSILKRWFVAISRIRFISVLMIRDGCLKAYKVHGDPDRSCMQTDSEYSVQQLELEERCKLTSFVQVWSEPFAVRFVIKCTSGNFIWLVLVECSDLRHKKVRPEQLKKPERFYNHEPLFADGVRILKNSESDPPHWGF